MKQRTEPLRAIARFLLAFYRIHLSGSFGGVCRYEPSCSCYAEEAFEKFSPAYAFYLTFRRILRCHPFGRSGYDPVPPCTLHHGRET